MAFSTKIESSPIAGINVTPLVDVLLVLLIIFMISAQVVVHKNQVDLPAAGDAYNATPEPLRVPVAPGGMVFLNGTLLYAGNAGFGTRDPEFLGIVGLFDELALPLRRGPNELWFAVSETFGGWAVTADVPDRAGITIGPSGR